MTTVVQEVEINPSAFPFTVVVMQEEATDGSLIYRAEIPELPGCMSHGETKEEAVSNLKEAMDLYLETVAGPLDRVPRHKEKAQKTIGTSVGPVVKARRTGETHVVFTRVEVRK